MLNQVVLAVKASILGGPSKANGILRQILDHAKTSGLVDHLCMCLEASGTSLISGSANLSEAASESCKALWCLIDALENLSLNEKAYSFPLSSLRGHSLVRLDLREHDRYPEIGTECEKVLETITRAFLKSKPVHVAIYCCLRQRADTVLLAVIQVCEHTFITVLSFHTYGRI